MPALMNNDIETGRFRKVIEIQQNVTASDDVANQPIPNWKPILKARCEIATLTGRALELALQVVAEATHQVEMRFRPGIKVGMRVLYVDGISRLSTYFPIIAVIDPDMLHKKLYLLCNEAPQVA